jgi:hypothetical protein
MASRIGIPLRSQGLVMGPLAVALLVIGTGLLQAGYRRKARNER